MSDLYAYGPDYTIAKYFKFNVAPQGTKLFILNLGYLETDEGFLLGGANARTRRNTEPERRTRKLQMYAVLIDHPSAGLILWETGPGVYGDFQEQWGSAVCDVFTPVDRQEDQALDAAITNAGYSIWDVKHVVLGHLHIDHAGGLQYFKGRTDVQVWVHELEFKHAFWSVGTKTDVGAYQSFYLDLNLNWVTFDSLSEDLFPGITAHLSPGHTPGLTMLQVNLSQSGTVIFTSDHIHTREAYETSAVPGWLLRDHTGWQRSTYRLKQLQKFTNGTVVFGHDPHTLNKFIGDKKFIE